MKTGLLLTEGVGKDRDREEEGISLNQHQGITIDPHLNKETPGGVGHGWKD